MRPDRSHPIQSIEIDEAREVDVARSADEGDRRVSRDRRVVVTGIGPVTAIGTGVGALREGLRAARSPIRTASTFDAEPFRSRMAAEIPGFDASEHLDPK